MKPYPRSVFLALGVSLLGATSAQAASGGAAAMSPKTVTTPAATSTPAPSAQPATTSPDAQPLALNRRQLRTVQRHVGTSADGKLDYATRGALKHFQRRHRLVVTGHPDIETLRAMKLGLADVFAARLQAASEPGTAASVGGVSATMQLSVPAPTAAAGAAIAAALGQVGSRYVSGGQTPGSFDCSGLTMWAFKQAGISLPRTSFEQYKVGTAVDRSAILPGDLVFFDSGGPGASHVGIAVSPTTAISATLHGVMVHQLFDSYWGGHFIGARRITS